MLRCLFYEKKSVRPAGLTDFLPINDFAALYAQSRRRLLRPSRRTTYRKMLMKSRYRVSAP